MFQQVSLRKDQTDEPPGWSVKKAYEVCQQPLSKARASRFRWSYCPVLTKIIHILPCGGARILLAEGGAESPFPLAVAIDADRYAAKQTSSPAARRGCRKEFLFSRARASLLHKPCGECSKHIAHSPL